MRTTRELLAAVKARHQLTSDYQLAKFLGVSRQRISGYQSGTITLGDELAITVADALGIERGRALAIVSAERAQSATVKKEWQKLAGIAAALALVAVAVQFAPSGSDLNALFSIVAAIPAGFNISIHYALVAGAAVLYAVLIWVRVYLWRIEAPEPPRP